MTIKYKELSQKFKSQSEALKERAKVLESKHVPPSKKVQHENTIERLKVKAENLETKANEYAAKTYIANGTPETQAQLTEKIRTLIEKRETLSGTEKKKITRQIAHYKRRLVNHIILS